MVTYTHPQIQEMLQLHMKWLAGEEGGVRANLDGASLSGANLRSADLDGANLTRANLYGANLDGVKNFQPFISVGPLGSRKGYTYINLNEDVIRCGCFYGTLAEFREAVSTTHAGNEQHRTSYMAVIAMVEALRAGKES